MKKNNISLALKAIELIKKGGYYPTKEKPTGNDVADCKSFVELALNGIGFIARYRGSNEMLRTLTEGVQRVSNVMPIGALLYMVRNDGKEPERYQAGGAGYVAEFDDWNAHHIGIYLGNGYVAESAYSIGQWAITKQAERKFTHYGAVHNLEYVEDNANEVLNAIKAIDTVAQPAREEIKTHSIIGYVDNAHSTFVNLREEPNLSANVIAEMHNGEKISIIKNVKNRWTYIDYKGQKGYCRTGMLSIGSKSNTFIAVAENVELAELKAQIEFLKDEIQELKERCTILENNVGMGVG